MNISNANYRFVSFLPKRSCVGGKNPPLCVELIHPHSMDLVMSVRLWNFQDGGS